MHDFGFERIQMVVDSNSGKLLNQSVMQNKPSNALSPIKDYVKMLDISLYENGNYEQED